MVQTFKQFEVSSSLYALVQLVAYAFTATLIGGHLRRAMQSYSNTNRCTGHDAVFQATLNVSATSLSMHCATATK
eukprot:6189942-Pleurochrysis_carterae.AAC.1